MPLAYVVLVLGMVIERGACDTGFVAYLTYRNVIEAFLTQERLEGFDYCNLGLVAISDRWIHCCPLNLRIL